MISAAYDRAGVEKKIRHVEAANVLENVDSSHGIHGPRSAPSTETATRLCLTRWGLATRAGWDTA